MKGVGIMKRNHSDYKLVPFPTMRRVLSAMLSIVQRKHMMHGLVEMDITKPHRYMQEYKARTGESLSFTAFIATCLARAIDEDKYMHAYRKGRNQLVIFDDVDVTIQVERKMDNQKNSAPSAQYAVSSQQHEHRTVETRQHNRVDTLFPHIVRAANKKTFKEIHQEIRAAQEAKVEKTMKYKAAKWAASLPDFMIVFIWWLLWLIIKRYPRLQKKYGGTVGISAVGMFGRGSGWGIPTATHILDITLGGIGEKPAVVDGRVEIREYLNITISVDHDIIDGAPATRFARRFKELIEGGYGLIEQPFVSGQTITQA